MAARFSSPKFRGAASTALKVTAGAAASYAVFQVVQQQRQLRLDSQRDTDPILKAPPLSWVPPSREEMISALKKNAVLHPKYEPSSELAQARKDKSDADAYDLLVSLTYLEIGRKSTNAVTCLRSSAVVLQVPVQL